ncbi:serine hydrolase [Caulobacter rhizosphaerae]|nr:serine hydrolase [Caulobacter rhizosphaerae]
MKLSEGIAGETATTPRAAGIDRRGLLALGGGAALGALFGTPATAAGNDHFVWKPSAPQAGGFSASGLEGVRAAIQGQIDAGIISGAVSAVARHNKLVWCEAQGLADPIAKIPMRKDAIFRMMSSTKHVTAVAVLMMVDEGKIALDDPISRFIPEFKSMKVAVPVPGTKDPSQVTLVPAEREITVENLLTHTSGLPAVGGFGKDDVASPGRPQHALTDTLATWTPKLATLPLEFQPGSKFNYSPLEAHGTALRLVEIVSGQPAEVFMQERIFQPLGMHDTYFNVPARKQNRIVPLVDRVDGQWAYADALLGRTHMSYIAGGGGLLSTVRDFMLFDLMLLNRGSLNGQRILKPQTVDLMSRDHVGALFKQWIPPITGHSGFGLSVRIVEDPSKSNGRSKGAYGWGGAYGTETWVEPERDLVAAFFIQLAKPPFASQIPFETAMQKALVA